MFKKLFRRSSGVMLLDVPTVIDVTNGGQRNILFVDFPGWYAVDIMMKVKNQSDGNLGKGTLKIKVDGVEKTSYRASWPWTRTYIYMPHGYRQITFEPVDFQAGDVAKIRYQNAQYFIPIQGVEVIEQAQPPEPMEEMIAIELLGGYSRYQSMSKRGTQIKFTMVIRGTQNYRNFMTNFTDYYILWGDEGLYGGVLLPQETDQKKVGRDIYLITTVLHSPSKAGEGF